TPFGHTGEDVLEARMAAFGGFDHNAQALRIVTRLERRYAAFDGLNLTWETLEGLVKHNGPLLDAAGNPTSRYAKSGVPLAILEYNALQDLELATHAGGEAQAAAVADDIAYNAHDIDDGLRAGLFDIEALREVAFLDDILREIDSLYPGLDLSRRIHELVRRVITRFVEDVVNEGERRLAALAPASADAIRGAAKPAICFSNAMQAADAAVKGFLYPHMYRHPHVMAVRHDADAILNDLFARFMAEPEAMPAEWQTDLPRDDEPRLARRVADYIAGMTDRYAILEHQRLFDVTPDLR
ncbi:MAG: deoxyguanosinetriphosphate triphosphohydrolase, partial [Microvirga sp.]|nr:deoxyguanosinetriphosphate triphosphohydrolase [Microvirga sp.]